MMCLNNYFRYLKSTRIKNDFNLLKEYPRYDELVRKYEAKYKESLTAPIVLTNKISTGQVYSIPYDLIGGDKFELNISIDKLYNLINCSDAINLIKNRNVYKRAFNLKLNNCDEDICKMNFDSRFLNSILPRENIDKSYASNLANKEEDIICGDFLGITSEQNPFVILDGNHRCYAKIKNGDKMINGVLISRNVWINCLLTKSDETFIKIFSNMNLILSYRNGTIDYEYVKERLYEV